MENFLIDYLEKSQAGLQYDWKNAGPVITISRECGCSANRIARGLAKVLNGYVALSGKGKKREWKWLNKEVVEEAASQLEITPDKIKSVFLKEIDSSLYDVQSAFSAERVYDSEDEQVIHTMQNVIERLAVEGNSIIVGRGANIIASNIESRLSVKLYAPLEWRIKQIMEVSSMKYADSRDYVLTIDDQRDLFVQHLAGREVQNTDFDMTFNYATMSNSQIVDAIIVVMKGRRLIA
ncbi:MAG: cytidylate kinase-like family protein [Prolixibacteraceae bacterium]|jgi:cytidylate kinase|nr:cytidylate kinase-like family protein [Prolixibacteraceae bacterium]